MKVSDLCLTNKGNSDARLYLWNVWVDANKVRIRRQRPSTKLLGNADWARKARAKNGVGRPPCVTTCLDGLSLRVERTFVAQHHGE